MQFAAVACALKTKTAIFQQLRQLCQTMHSLVQHVGAAGKMHPEEVTGSLKKLEPGTAAIMASVPPQVTQISVLESTS